MGQFISFKREINNPWFNPWFILLHTHSNVCATVEGRCLEYLVRITLLSARTYILRDNKKDSLVLPFKRTSPQKSEVSFYSESFYFGRFFIRIWSVAMYLSSTFHFLNYKNWLQIFYVTCSSHVFMIPKFLSQDTFVDLNLFKTYFLCSFNNKSLHVLNFFPYDLG